MNSIESMPTICATSAVPAASPRLESGVPAPASHGSSFGPAAGTATTVHAQKRLAMAGIDTNVWPLGPEEMRSG